MIPAFLKVCDSSNCFKNPTFLAILVGHASSNRQGFMISAFLYEPYVSSNRFDETAAITHSWGDQPEWLMILAFFKVDHSSIPGRFLLLAFLHGL